MQSSENGPTLELLLADAQTGRPTLPEGLTPDAILAITKPSRAQGARDGYMLEAPSGQPEDLAVQRWGLIAPVGPEGDALLAAVADLTALREAEQGDKAIVFRVNPSMTWRDAASFRETVYMSESLSEADRPRYLLILGDLHQVSLELQQALAVVAFVGRLHFDDLAGYRAYAEKVRRSVERASVHAAPDALFYAARDPTMTTIAGYKQLVKPCAEAAASWKRSGRLATENIHEVTKWGVKLADFMAPASGERPAVLLSSSHGLGLGLGEPAAKRRALQGALSLGTAGTLSAETLAGSRFLPGGMWLCVACYGAGTPSSSAYAAWLSGLAKQGAGGPALDSVLASLPPPGEPPFIAALPKAALANAEGPLGVIAHVDLAWSYSFLSTETFNEGRASRIFSALRVLIGGGRAGVALDALMRSYRAANDDLMAGYEAQENARAFGRADPTDPWRRGHTWMLRNDLRGYILLGDPAARISLRGKDGNPAGTKEAPKGVAAAAPIAAAAPVAAAVPVKAEAGSPAAAPIKTEAAPPAAAPIKAEAAPPAAVSTTAPAPTTTREAGAAAPGAARVVAASPAVWTPSAADKDAAVMAMLRGDEAPRAIAARVGVSVEMVWAWVDAYRSGGQAALAGHAAPKARRIRSSRPM